MARLTSIFRTEDTGSIHIARRQLPVVAGENLMMLMDLNSKGLAIDSPQIRGKELEEFTRKFNLLTHEELRQSLTIDNTTFCSVLNQCVQCVGCRRRVEHLFYQLTLSGHPTLEPLVWRNSWLTVNEEKLKTPQALGTLLYRHHEVINSLLDDNKLRNKTRCLMHSLDTFRTRPFSETWRELWSSIRHNCRDELAVIETKELHEVLEIYLKKHKFCQGCRTKIEKAYKILVGESSTKEKGYVAALYANIKRCQPDEHIHVLTNKVDFLDALIRRAEPEVNGSYAKQRERHAKTLEIAQEEVLNCVGMIMYERLRRIYVSLREEERACQVLAAVGVHALCRGFDMFVEQKQGISNLELLCQDITRAERAKQHKREQRKLKKKQKKCEKKRQCGDAKSAVSDGHEEDDEDDEVEADEEAGFGAGELKAAELSATEEEDELDEAVELDGDSFEEHEVAPNGKSVEPVVVPSPQAPKHKQAKQTPKKKTKKQPPQKQQKPRSAKQINVNAASACTAIAAKLPDVDVVKCVDCLEPTPNCPCDVKDSGYGSELNSRDQSRTSSVACSPEGSEVSCSDGFCNHDEHGVGGGGALLANAFAEVVVVRRQSTQRQQRNDHLPQQVCANEACESSLCIQQRTYKLSLQQMLDDAEEYDADQDDCYIPPEVVLEYQCQREQVQQQRQQLRETLRQNFARLCMQRRELSSAACK